MYKPSHKTLVFLTIALLGTICIAIGAWWVTQKPQPVPVPVVNTNTQPTETTTSGTVVPPTKTDCTDELDTECWNTYVNEEYGFSFKFPKKQGQLNTKANTLTDLAVYPYFPLQQVFFSKENEKQYPSDSIYPTLNELSILVDIFPNPEKLIPEYFPSWYTKTFFSDRSIELQFDTKKDVHGNMTASFFVFDRTADTEPTENYNVYMLLNNDQILRISFFNTNIMLATETLSDFIETFILTFRTK